MKRTYMLRMAICQCLIFAGLSVNLMAQKSNQSFKPTCEVQTPKEVQQGELFTYTIITNAKTEINDPDFGPFLVNGQASNSSKSIKVENGKRYTKTRREHIFYLMADTVGTFTIPANEIVVNGKKVTLKSAQITVVPATTATQDILTVSYGDTFYNEGDLSTFDMVEDVEEMPEPECEAHGPRKINNILLYILLGIVGLFVLVLLLSTYKPVKEHFKSKNEATDPNDGEALDDVSWDIHSEQAPMEDVSGDQSGEEAVTD